MHCTHCGNNLGREDKFCSHCGKEYVPPTPQTGESDAHSITTEGSTKPRPWRRLFARYIDTLGVGILLGLWTFGMDEVSGYFLGMGAMFLWVLIEPIFLRTLGTTPGKYLLNISLRHSSGGKPGYSTALARSALVWIFGWGLGLPIVSLATLLYSYGQLTKKGDTPWDQKLGFSVRCGEIGFGRLFAITALIFLSLILFLFVIGQS